MSGIDRSPALLSSAVAVVFGLVAVVVGFYSPIAMALAGVGFLVLLLGVFGGRQAAVTLGATGLVGGAIAAGTNGAPAAVPVLAVTATAIAWDAGGNGIVVGRQLGREADTVRIEALHIGTTALVGLLTAGVSYGLYRTATGGKPLTALLFLLLAAVLVGTALR